MTTDADEAPAERAQAGSRLDSWKEIATYLNRGVTTVQRWEQNDGLPIRRLTHAKRGSVFAYREELDRWLETRGQLMERSPGLDEPAPATVVETSPRRSVRALSVSILTVATVIVVTAAGAAWRYRVHGSESRPEPLAGRAVALRAASPLLGLGERTEAPSLSPDGQRVAFTWLRDGGNAIYVRNAAGGTPRAIWPFDPAEHGIYITRWSPNGALIAFNSEEGTDRYGLYVLASNGGPVTRVTTMAGVGICWAPDGQSITFVDRTSPTEPFSLYAVDLANHERRRLTAPAAGSFGDTACDWSPDGKRLAFSRFLTRHESVLMTAAADNLGPTSPLEPRTIAAVGMDDVAWTPDGQAIVFSGYRGLQIVPATGPATMGTLFGNESGVVRRISFARTTDGPLTFVYQLLRVGVDAQMWTAADPSHLRLWGDGSHWTEFPALSRDGRAVAYMDEREVWAADVSGSHPRQLTFRADPQNDRIVTNPQWSPDGTRIAFSMPVGDQRDIYTIRSDGSDSARLTSDPSLEDNPTWSADGQSIYFRSDRTGLNHLWKIASSGGEAVQVTRGEAWQGFETFDGTTLYFVRGTTQAGLWAMRLDGASEHLVIPEVRDGLWGLSEKGIVYVANPDAQSTTLSLWPFDSGRPQALMSLPRPPSSGLAVSRDGSTVLLTDHRTPTSTILASARWDNGQ